MASAFGAPTDWVVTAGEAAGAELDGWIPFGDPIGKSGGYDYSNSAYAFSRGAGEISRDAAIGAYTAVIGTVYSANIAATKFMGRGSWLFGRGGQYGLRGIANGSNAGGHAFRIGWSWEGTFSGGKEVLRIAIGKTPKSWSPAAQSIVNYLRHFVIF